MGNIYIPACALGIPEDGVDEPLNHLSGHQAFFSPGDVKLQRRSGRGISPSSDTTLKKTRLFGDYLTNKIVKRNIFDRAEHLFGQAKAGYVVDGYFWHGVM
jgi:hypothetical protein